MNEVDLPEIYAETQRVYKLLDVGNFSEAADLTIKIETRCSEYVNSADKGICQKYVAICLIDCGTVVKNEEMVRRGTQYLEEWNSKYPPAEDNLAAELYNIANGYFTIWKLKGEHHLAKGIDAEEHKLARRCYKLAIEHIKDHHISSGLACEMWTNYANALDSIWRDVEALDAYDRALQVRQDMGMALGNKAVTLLHLAPMMDGHVHRFYLESQRLLELALEQSLTPEARVTFKSKLTQLQEFLEKHGEMLPEDVEALSPSSEFHIYLCAFCSQYNLFLNPVTFLGEDEKAIYGDPMFISRMQAPIGDMGKFDRYVTFLNEIKQDYVLGRYFLAQSRYQVDWIEAVDSGVSLFYPLDYSLNSTYIQLMKTAHKQAVSVLDKVGYFIYDYYKLSKPPENQVNFIQVWQGKGSKTLETMRVDLRSRHNPYLMALFALSRDIAKSGDWQQIIKHRNVVTHRFLVLHGMQLSDQPNADIPRMQEDEFLAETIMVMKIARAAVMYLILLVEYEERRAASLNEGLKAPIYAVPLEEDFRHRPWF